MVGGKGGLYLVSYRDFFWGINLAGVVSYPKEVINSWDHLMHAIELGSKIAQSYPFEPRSTGIQQEQTKGNFVMK